MALLDLEDPLVHQVTTALLEKTVPMACPVPQAKTDLMALQVLQVWVFLKLICNNQVP